MTSPAAPLFVLACLLTFSFKGQHSSSSAAKSHTPSVRTVREPDIITVLARKPIGRRSLHTSTDSGKGTNRNPLTANKSARAASGNQSSSAQSASENQPEFENVVNDPDDAASHSSPDPTSGRENQDSVGHDVGIDESDESRQAMLPNESGSGIPSWDIVRERNIDSSSSLFGAEVSGSRPGLVRDWGTLQDSGSGLVRARRQISRSNLFRDESQISRSNLFRGESQISRSNLVRDESQISRSYLARDESQHSRSKPVRTRRQNSRSPLVRDESQNSRSPLVRDESQNSRSNLARDESQHSRPKLVRTRRQNARPPQVRDESQTSRTPLVRDDSQDSRSVLVRGGSNGSRRQPVGAGVEGGRSRPRPDDPRFNSGKAKNQSTSRGNTTSTVGEGRNSFRNASQRSRIGYRGKRLLGTISPESTRKNMIKSKKSADGTSKEDVIITAILTTFGTLVVVGVAILVLGTLTKNKG